MRNNDETRHHVHVQASRGLLWEAVLLRRALDQGEEEKQTEEEDDPKGRTMTDDQKRIESLELELHELQQKLCFLYPAPRQPLPKSPLEPDAHWSFKATPPETDIARILEDAEADGLKAVAMTVCGVPLIALHESEFNSGNRTPFLYKVDMVLPNKRDGWAVMVVDGDPVVAMADFLAKWKEWQQKKHRTTVAGWKVTE